MFIYRAKLTPQNRAKRQHALKKGKKIDKMPNFNFFANILKNLVKTFDKCFDLIYNQSCSLKERKTS